MKAKHLFVTLMLGIFCLSLTTSCVQGRAKTPKEAEITFVAKMSCGSCQRKIEAILSEAVGVKEFKTDLPSKEVWVLYETDKTDVATLIEVIGYAAVEKLPPAEITFVTQMSCGSCQRKIEAILSEAVGVKEFKTDLPTKEVWVLYEPNKTDVATLIEVIGYAATEK
ncbi:MAG: cation transporter [Bacteroidales bacterium]|nr:cation transporter [Bacteroidales bacterium]